MAQPLLDEQLVRSRLRRHWGLAAPTTLRVDRLGRVGVIDWGQVVWGSLLYDVGSAVVLQRLGDQLGLPGPSGNRVGLAAALRALGLRPAPDAPG